MVGFLITLAIYIAGTLLYELLRPKPKFDAPSPSGLGDIQFPTIEAGRPIPIIWGTVKLSGPAVVWYGDLDVVPITEKVKTGLFSSETITTGYRYYLGVELVFSSGVVDSIEALWFDERAIAATKNVTADRDEFTINAPNFFGGDDEEGGIVGHIYVYRGTESQAPDDYLEATLGVPLSAYRNICRAVFRHVYLGTSPYMKPFAIVAKRLPNQLGLAAGEDDIGGDANPAAMLFDIITSSPSKNGLGIPAAFVDQVNFRAVGSVLKSESLGLSMVQDSGTRARDLVLDILRHIDAMLYVEPATGLLKLFLVRQDYDPETLPVLDASNCVVAEFARPSWPEVRNAVRVRYVDRADGFVEKMVQAQELAAIDIAGGELNFQDFDFRGFSNATNAQKAVGRALAAVSYPLATLTVRVNRSGWDLRPGMVRKLNWPPLGISGLAIRIGRARGGDLEDGTIEFEAMEDVFGVPWTAYAEPPPSAWTDPAGNVPPLAAAEAIEAPYPAVASLTPPPSSQSRAVVLAARGSGITKGYRVFANVGGWQPAVEFRALTPMGTLTNALTELSTSIQIDDGIDTSLLDSISDEEFAAGVNVLLVDNEFIAFKTVTPGSGAFVLSNLARGCIDSVPEAHPAGATVWFVSNGSGIVGIGDYPVSTSIRFQAFNNRSEIPLGSAPIDSVSASNPDRALRVYAPTAVKFNGDSYPASITGALTVSWSHRNRLGTWSYADSGKTATAEPGTEYDVLVYGELGTLVHTESGLTGTSWTYPEADEIAESGLGRLNNHLRVIIRTFGAGRAHVAIREIEWAFNRS